MPNGFTNTKPGKSVKAPTFRSKSYDGKTSRPTFRSQKFNGANINKTTFRNSK